MIKHLLRLNNQGKASIVAEISPEVKAIAATGDTIYMTSPAEGIIYSYNIKKDSEPKIFLSELPQVRGLFANSECLYCESLERSFFGIRIFNKFPFSMVGERGTKFLGPTQTSNGTSRINGIFYRYSNRNFLMAYPEKHRVYALWENGVIDVYLGDGKKGFSVGGPGLGRLSSPHAVVSCENRVFVSDTGNNVIREYIAGNNGHLIGSPIKIGQEDGLYNQARLTAPTELAVNANTVFFVDNSNSVRFFLLPNLTVSTMYRSQHSIEAITVSKDGSVFCTEIA